MVDRQTLRALRCWLGLQVLASVIFNELGAEPTWQSRIVALPAPLILFGSIESMLRIPGGRDLISVVRGVATIAIGSAAAFLSFATIGRLGHEAGLTVQEQIALVVIIDGGMLVVALTLLMISRRRVPARQRRRREVLRTEQPNVGPAKEPADSLEVPEPGDLNVELTKEDRQGIVLARSKVGATAPEIADLTGASVRTVRRDLAELRDAGRLLMEEPV